MKVSLKRKLMTDSVWIKFQNILEHVNNLAQFDNYVSEMESLHAGRASRNLHLKSPSPKRLIDAAAQDSSYRSRCVEIMLTVLRAQRMLNASIEATTNHLVAKYSSEIPGSTKGEREQYIKAILSSAYEKLSDLERITEAAEYLIEDIDKASFALKHQIDAVSLILTRETNLSKR